MRKHAPIIIFAFNRLEPLKRCVASLQKNTETKDSDLHIEKDQSLITVIELGSDIVDKESQN